MALTQLTPQQQVLRPPREAANPAGPYAAAQNPKLKVSQADAMAVVFGLREHLPVNAPTDPDYWFEYLDNVGPEAVLEHIASGQLPVEIAVTNRIPHLIFRRWMDKRIDPAQLAEALSIHAELLVLKAQISLAETPAGPADAMMTRAESERFAWLAERLDSKRWGPPGKSAEKPAPVSISMNFGGGENVTVTVNADGEPGQDDSGWNTHVRPSEMAEAFEALTIEARAEVVPSEPQETTFNLDTPITKEMLAEQFLATFGRLPDRRSRLKDAD